MKRTLPVFLAFFVLGAVSRIGTADDADAKAILDKGIKALGGEEKLSKIAFFTWKAKGKANFGGNESEFSIQETAQGLENFRSEFEGEFGGNKIKGVTVHRGEKAWMKFGEMGGELEGDILANEKRNMYLRVIPATLVPLKGKGFKIETAGEDKVNDKPAVGLKITAPDGKDFTLYFDKASGLPVKQVAAMSGFMGDEFQQETTYSNYKDFGGIKKAMKVEAKRNDEPFLTQEITEFKVLDKVPAETFDEPK